MARSTSASNREALLLQDDDFLDITRRALTPSQEIDIVSFAEDPRFLGKSLFPRQKTLLRLIYLDTDNMTAYDIDVINEWAEEFKNSPENDRKGVSPDVWERIDWLKANGYPHFHEVLNISGRRSGKGVIGAICGAYQNWKLIGLDDPQWHYGLEPGKDLYLFVTATNLVQAKQYQFADLANTVLNAPCFEKYLAVGKEYFVALRTPADLRRIAALETRGIRTERLIASLRNVAMSSNSRSGRGAAAFAQMFDEFAHMLTGTAGPRTGDEVYNAATPALDQLGKDGLIYIPSSPYTKVGKAYELYEDALKVDAETGAPLNPEMLVIQLPSWGPYEDWNNLKATGGRRFRSAPQLYDDQMRRLEKREPDVFKVERKSQWAEVIDAYLNPKMVDRMFEPYEGRVLEPQKHGVMKWVYRGHADPSKANANFAVAFGHAEPFTEAHFNPETGRVEEDTWYHVFIDWMNVWKPEDYPDHQVPYDLIEDELAGAIARFPTMNVFSYDQYGSFVTVPRLKSRLRGLGSKTSVKEETFTHVSNTKRAERFKSALGLNWVHAYKDDFGPEGVSLLELELKFLQEKNGKVIKQSLGPVTTKDLADCVMVIVDQLLADQLERLRTREALAETRVTGDAVGGYSTKNGAEGAARQKLSAFNKRRNVLQRARRIP